MNGEPREDSDRSLKSIINEIIRKTYKDELKIPNAVEKITALVKDDNEKKSQKKMNKVDPLFEKGPLPVDELKHCVIQEIQETKNGNYKYFIHDTYNAYGSGWLYEDELIERIKKEQKTE